VAEFHVEIEIELPPSLAPEERAALTEAERVRGRELVAAGAIVHIWRLPGRIANVGIWQAADATELHELLASLPMWRHARVRVRALARHPLSEDAE
jgi:muconolactone D-isomerase